MSVASNVTKPSQAVNKNCLVIQIISDISQNFYMTRNVCETTLIRDIWVQETQNNKLKSFLSQFRLHRNKRGGKVFSFSSNTPRGICKPLFISACYLYFAE